MREWVIMIFINALLITITDIKDSQPRMIRHYPVGLLYDIYQLPKNDTSAASVIWTVTVHFNKPFPHNQLSQMPVRIIYAVVSNFSLCSLMMRHANFLCPGLKRYDDDVKWTLT